MDLHSVRFALKHLLQLVSSAVHLVVLFLNTIQCCDGLLCNASGSCCCFFVGSYCWNEVSVSHALHHLIGARQRCRALRGWIR